MATTRFFDDDGMDFATRCVLSGVRHGMAELGEVVVTNELITDGSPDSWLDAYVSLGRRLRTEADVAAAAGHRQSAWNAALRATNYLFAGLWWAPATASAEATPVLWDEHRAAWDVAVAHWPSPVWPMRIPYLQHTLPGHWFHARSAAADDGPRPVLVLVQGLNTPVSDALMTGMDGALDRGYHVLLLDGPGQGAALRRQGLTVVPDWSGVLGGALEWLASRPEVDRARIVVSGVDHGAYFAASALAAEPDLPVAALVVDPGVVDLGADARAAVDDAAGDAQALALLAGTTTVPTGADSLEGALAVLDTCRLDPERLAAVRTPTFVVIAEDATSFAGQGATLLESLPGVARPIRLDRAEGAGSDCGIDASQVHDARVFDQLDDLLRTI